MDANQTRFHMLFGEADWRPVLERAAASGEGSGVAWEDASHSVTLARRLFRFERSPADLPPALERRRGAAVDRYGNWYWIAADGGEIQPLPAGLREPERLWPVPLPERAPAGSGGFAPVEPKPAPPLSPMHGLAVTEDHYLVAGTLAPAGLLIFDLHAGGPPLWMAWPDQAPFAPYDMANGPEGTLYILDREHRRYWILDRHFQVLDLDQERVQIEPVHEFHFHPDAGPERRPKPARWFPTGIALPRGAPFEAESPIAIEALPDGSVLILDAPAGDARVLWYSGSALQGAAELAGVFEDQPFAAFDFAFLRQRPGDPPEAEGAAVTGTLYVAGADGNQSFAFALRAQRPGSSPAGEGGLQLELEMRYLPMRSFGGRGLVPARGAGGEEVVYYDREERGVVTWVELVEKPRPRYAPAGVLPEVGVPIAAEGFAGLAFDGKERGCVWHRLMLDAVIPPGAAIVVESRAADDPALLAATPWQREPDPYLRPMGSEIPFYRPFPRRPEASEGAGTWELLLQQARGRYLQLRLSLFGTGRNTPRLRALRVYYPRFSYLEKYLPAVYREDPVSASFLERFLANPEGILTALEDRIAHAQVLFDPRTAPAESLEWLAGWLGLALDASWDEHRRRLLIKHAPRMFAERGTAAGIVRAIRLATDPCPDDSLFTEPVLEAGGLAVSGRGARSVRIVEQFRTRRTPGIVFGDPGEAEGPGVTSPHMPWSPAQGPDPLHQRYRQFLLDRYGDVDAVNRALGTSYAAVEEIEFPPAMPEARSEADVWRAFVRSAIGFPYAAVDGADREAYQRFLQQRYRRISAFAAAAPEYAALGVSSFADVPLPRRLPTSRRALTDWIQFASLYLPALERAHRFTVLVPIWGEVGLPGGGAGGERLAMGPDPEVVRRVVELEKPAHTHFEIKPYWAMFRVGEARLGIDTQPGQSSRLAAAIVGRGALGEVYLAHAHPWNVRERTIVGRDRVG